MPTDTVWIVVKIPKKDYEKEKLNISTNILNLNNEGIKLTIFYILIIFYFNDILTKNYSENHK